MSALSSGSLARDSSAIAGWQSRGHQAIEIDLVACRRARPLPDGLEDGPLIGTAVHTQQPAPDRLDTTEAELQNEVEHPLPVF
jgi:hypothetical protein